MACYYGCSTGANKCAYFWWFLLILAGGGCLVGWYFKSDECIEQTEDCLMQQGVTSEGFFAGFDPKDVYQSFMGGVNGTTVCEAAFPEAGPESQQIQGCVICYDQVAPCFEQGLGVFIAGIVLLAASFVSCFFCCCCASAPRSKHYY
mmetsp:Transcript_30093/g.84961  ORF Transcript_30093/g.84961 Transcript_30093/m.84961 type:complete len:147 (+) Transcript_30093:288-728(+)